MSTLGQAFVWTLAAIAVTAVGGAIDHLVGTITSRLDAIKEQLKLINEELRRR